MNWWRSLNLFFLTHRRGLLIGLCVPAAAYILLNAGFTAVSGNEATCLACHEMAPYHRTWRQSTHDGVACVRCHDLGFNYFTSALLKTAAGFRNPRPLAVVRNEACLQPGCHSERLAAKRGAGQFKGRVAFDHASHLGELRRGERLWCTSCHSSDEEGGTHFTTQEGACYICHFKGAAQGKSVTPCSTCHTAPAREVSHAGFSFDHQAYLKLGVTCDECHTKIVSGDAEVDPIRCRDCHAERLEKKGDFAFMHDTHASERGISCFRCHSRIEHRSVEYFRALDVRCESCHSELHSPQKQLYMGVGGRGLSDVPGRMFAAKVSCEGCHVSQVDGAAPGARLDSMRQACIRCHDVNYGAMLDSWLAKLKTALDYARPYESEARAMLATPGADHPMLEQINDALHNFDLVRRGAGAHNVEYAVRALVAGIDNVKLAAGALDRPLPRAGAAPRVLDLQGGYCMALCHGDVATPGDTYFAEMEIDFPHDSHGNLSCATCHSPLKHKQRVISKQECMTCHHSDEGRREYGVDCSDCHAVQAALYTGRVRVAGLRIEPDAMAEADVGCTDCHDVGPRGETLRQIIESCNECHVGEKIDPYPVDDYLIEEELTMRRRSDALLVRLEAVRAALAGRADEESRRLLAEAESDLDVVVRGRHHHNFAASKAILGKVESTLARLEGTTGR